MMLTTLRAIAVAIPLLGAVTSLALPATAQRSPDFSQWPNTDFDNTTIDLAEVFSGGVPRDGIPAVDVPIFVAVAQESRIGGREPVLTLALTGQTPRAYPLRYLT